VAIGDGQVLARTVQGRLTIGLLVTGLALGGLLFAGRQSLGSPEQTIATFLTAAAAGDGATACAQLSPQAQRQLGTGPSCVQAIRQETSLYSSISKQIKVTVRTTRPGGTIGTAAVRGAAVATFRMSRSGGRWLIASQHLTGTSGTSWTAASYGPSQARVASVAQCLDQTFGPVDNAGYDGSGGVPHFVLGVDVGGYSAAEVDVFDSVLAAGSGYRGIKPLEATLTTRLIGGSVVVYLRPVTTAQQRAIEACG
jgi:hypothetical protein